MTQEQVAVTAEKIRAGKTSLGIEFGSTRIKAVLIDDAYHTIAAGDYEWASHLEDGLWSYTQEEIWKGLQTAYARMSGDVETAYGERLTHVGHIGFSAMMHGYLAFDKSGELLVPFRTWQNTNTHEAHEKLSELFQYNIPERWSVAHLYQAVLNHEEHVSKVDYITTLAGYVHWKLTGEKVLGVGDASGMFPIDPATHTYETEFIKRFDAIEEVAAQPWKLENLLPRPLVAGTPAGTLTAEGAKLLDPTGTLQPGVVLAPPEGDAGTGMVATPQSAQDAANAIRDDLKTTFGQKVSDSVRILYGGSVTSKNAAELISQPDVDGFLIGGAALDVEELSKIARLALKTTSSRS